MTRLLMFMLGGVVGYAVCAMLAAGSEGPRAGVQTGCKQDARQSATTIDATCSGVSCVLITSNYQENR